MMNLIYFHKEITKYLMRGTVYILCTLFVLTLWPVSLLQYFVVKKMTIILYSKIEIFWGFICLPKVVHWPSVK